jgi:hypothetical protein
MTSSGKLCANAPLSMYLYLFIYLSAVYLTMLSVASTTALTYETKR